MLGPARPLLRAKGDAVRARQLEAGVVAIQVIARCRGETQQQRVAVAGDRLEAERLFRWQRQRIGADRGSSEQRVAAGDGVGRERSEEHTSELQSLMRISYAVFCLKKKKRQKDTDSSV